MLNPILNDFGFEKVFILQQVEKEVSIENEKYIQKICIYIC